MLLLGKKVRFIVEINYVVALGKFGQFQNKVQGGIIWGQNERWEKNGCNSRPRFGKQNIKQSGFTSSKSLFLTYI